MKKMTVIETKVEIQNEATIEMFNPLVRTMRDRGWNGVYSIIISSLRSDESWRSVPAGGTASPILEETAIFCPDTLD